MGDIAATIGMVLLANPDVDFTYTHRVDEKDLTLNTRELKFGVGGAGLERSHGDSPPHGGDPPVAEKPDIRHHERVISEGGLHMAKLTYEDLEGIREKAGKSMALRLGAADTFITVHMGTCGIAAGAREVMKALLEAVSVSGRGGIQVTASGCMGRVPPSPTSV